LIDSVILPNFTTRTIFIKRNSRNDLINRIDFNCDSIELDSLFIIDETILSNGTVDKKSIKNHDLK